MLRITKKDIWSSYGIEYDSKTGKILTPFGMWVNPLMPFGTNDKIGDCHSFSIYHGNELLKIEDFETNELVTKIMLAANISEIKASCPFHCKDCYCDFNKFQRYKTPKASAMRNLILARYFREWLENAITAQIIADKAEQVRIHVAGDFFSIEYAEMWSRIAKRFPNVIFWTYTKVPFALDILSNIDNLHIVPSLTPCGFNFGTCAELLAMYAKLTAMGYRVHICACGTEFQNHCANCKHGCKAIGAECDFVLFIKHSSKGYKAGKHDKAEFLKVLEIIARQAN